MGLKDKLYKTYFKIFCDFYKRSKLNSSYAAQDSGVWSYWGDRFVYMRVWGARLELHTMLCKDGWN